MCGRFNIITDPRAWMDALEVVRSSDRPGRFEPRYNIGPSEQRCLMYVSGFYE